MAYLDGRYSYHTAEQQPMLYYQHQPMQFPQYPAQGHQLDHYYPNYGQAEFTDFTHGGMQDEFEEGGEVSTRPRLTKEQVEVLETQFQQHPKPNSVAKRQLALQTKLTLPRVANWFQNRRAKAKQLKKQEEFEIKQQMGLSEGWKSEDNLCRFSPTACGDHTAHDQEASLSPSEAPHNNRPSSMPAIQNLDPAKEASWASLQRALQAAQAASSQDSQEVEYAAPPMPPPGFSRPSSNQPLSVNMAPVVSQHSTHSIPEWTNNSDILASGEWTTRPVADQIPFDFGFHQTQHLPNTSDEAVLGVSPHDIPSHLYNVPVEPWSQPLRTPTFPHHNQVPGLGSMDLSPAMHLPSYPNSRRGSTDDIAAGFGNVALAGTPPMGAPMSPLSGLESNRRFEGEIDLAARRKRPRPAALGTASLRSRSYGALTSMSPTFRPGSNLSSQHAIRHVKSTGHSLNARFAGVRKTNSAQRSPLIASSFAEAEALNQLMVQQAGNAQIQQDPLRSGSTTPFLSPEVLGSSQLPIQDNNNSTVGQGHEFHHHFPSHLIGQLHPSMTSPPATPFRSEYILQSQAPAMMPPVSAPPQYATFPDYTPPYSAGPLTSSSWSDAPLPSPDMPSFPHVTHLPSLAFQQQPDISMPQFQHFMIPQESRPESNYSANLETKKTEFCIQEFPGQKEEHAHVAQQLAQQQPKHYIFANSTPTDFDA